MHRAEVGISSPLFHKERGISFSTGLSESIWIHAGRMPMQGYAEASMQVLRLYEDMFAEKGLAPLELSGTVWMQSITEAYMETGTQGQLKINWPRAVRATLATMDEIGEESHIRKEVEQLIPEQEQNDLGYMMGMSDAYRICEGILKDVEASILVAA